MSNSTYAFIDENSVCVGVTEYQEAVTSDANMVLLESLDTSIIGQRWTGAVWEVVPLTAVTAREWRDGELYSTDWIVPVTDHPDHAAYLLYRQALRDWPSTPSFPDTKPVSP
jgi:hypothetical protein